MTDMTTTSLPVGQWTLIYTAAGAVTLTAQNLSKASEIKLRIGSTVGIGDALTAAADVLQPMERASITLATGDKIMARPVSDNGPGSINLRA